MKKKNTATYSIAFEILGGTNHIQTLCQLGSMYWRLRAKEMLSGKPMGFMGAVQYMEKAIHAFVHSFGAVVFDLGNPEHPDTFLVQKYISETPETGHTIEFKVDCIGSCIMEADADVLR